MENMKEILVEAPPPKYVSLAPRSRKWTGLSIYAVAMTMLLVATVVASVVLFVVRRVNTGIDIDALPSKVEHFRVNGRIVEQRVQMDASRETELIRYDDTGVVLVLDYRRGLTALYAPSAEECFLVGGIDRHLPSPFQSKVEKTEGEEDSSDDGAEVTYRKSASFPVMDHSVLPSHLTALCRNKPVFWMEAVPVKDAALTSQRTKRAPGRFCINVCANGRCYRRCWG